MRKIPSAKSFILLVIALVSCACTTTQPTVLSESFAPDSTEQKPKSPTENETIRFLENRVKNNSEDFIAYNKLASEYLRRMRETGDANYLNLANRAAESSLGILPAAQNKSGLANLALVKYSSHEFAAARDLARQLIELEPNKGYAFQILGDALLELGEYDEAERALQKMESFGGIQAVTKSAIEQRLARFAALKGDNNATQKHYSQALKFAESMPVPSPETIAYCNWQLGETAFARGDYKTAEARFKDALDALPDYPNALASTGKTLAASEDLSGAIEFYERAVKRLPDINFVAVLGDLYALANRDEDARRQFELVEQIARLNQSGGNLYNRALVNFYADHDLKIAEAYEMAAKEYETRRDIYGADALAWTAFKSGKIEEAQAKIKEAMRFKTADARLFYHAGMIANAAGDKDDARKFLERALALNPKFNLAQSEVCRKTLENLRS